MRSPVLEVSVGGASGLYIADMPHAVLLGRPEEDVPARLASDTLLFSRGNTLFRIEAEDLDLDRALEIARSLR